MNNIAERLNKLSPAKKQVLLQKLFEQGLTLANIPITPSQQEGPFPLSFAQQRLWMLDQLEPDLSAYHIPAVVRLTGKVDVPALQEAFNQLVARHDALRTTFALGEAGEPVQIVHRTVRIDLPVTQVSEADAAAKIREIVKRPFSLITPPLIRVQLLELAAEERLLVVVMHHIISDGWSISIVVRELGALYQAIQRGQENPLPPLAIQYPDFAIWQRQWMQGDILEQQLSYWQQHLADAPATLDLPTDFQRPTMQSNRGATYRQDFSEGLTQRIEQFSRTHDATPFMTMMAAYQLLLARYAGVDDIVVGSPIANRNRQEIENLIGFFVNMLVYRTRIQKQDSFSDVVAQVRQHALDGYARQDVPFEKLVQALNVTRDVSYSPIFQVVFIMQNLPQSALNLGEATMRNEPITGTTAKYDLTLIVMETVQGYRLLWEYCTDLFKEETIIRLSTHFMQLLDNLLAQPQTPVLTVPLLTGEERQLILSDWNATERPYPHQTVTQMFKTQAAQTPDAIAVTATDGELTYAELDTQSDKFAAWLRQRSLPPDTLIGVALPRDSRMLVTVLGILKAGAAYLPLDPAYPARRIQYMLDQAQAPLLITTSETQKTLPEHQASLILLDKQWADMMAMPPLTEECSRLDDLAYVIYTSGSTGKPKGVEIRHRNLANFLCGMQETPGICADDTMLAIATLSFDISKLELYLPLLCGARVLLVDQETAKDAMLLTELLNREPVTMMQATPATWQMLLAAGWQGKAGLTILSGAEAMSATLAKQLLARSTAVFNVYGPTETTVWATCGSVTEAECAAEGVISVGTPIANTDIYILDDYLNPVPIGVTGNLYIGGAGVGRGYLRQPHLTAERFLAHPFKPGEPIYYTGDLARYRADGNIEFLGRSDHQVKIRSFRIELGEIENSLQQHESVVQAVVHPYEDQLIAYLIADEEIPVSELRSHIKESLPEYMVPHRFITLEAFPLTPSGKVDRKLLPAPDTDTAVLASEYAAPRNAIEETLAGIWQELLKLPKVGIHDNFFELGGDSLLAIRSMSDAKRAGLQFTYQQFFMHQTIAELSPHVEALLLDEAEAIVETEEWPLTVDQYHFFDIDLVERQHFSLSTVYKTHIPIDTQALKESVIYLTEYHDILRARFEYDGTDWHQIIETEMREVPFYEHELDLTQIPHEDRYDAIGNFFNKIRRSINWPEGPFLQVHYIKLLGEDTNRLYLHFHHLLFDGVSIGIFIQDLLYVYTQRLQGKEGQLPPKPISAREWVERLKTYANSAKSQRELDYWLGLPWASIPRLPVDYENAHEGNVAGTAAKHVEDRIMVKLTEEETEFLLQDMPKEHGLSLETMILTAMTKAITEWTGSNWFSTQMIDSGRSMLADLEDVDLSRTIGWLSFTRRLALEWLPEKSLIENAYNIDRQVKQVPNRGLGFELLRRYSENRDVAAALEAVIPEVEDVWINYFGRSSSNPPNPFLERATEDAGGFQNDQSKRPYVLFCYSIIEDGQFVMQMAHSTAVHRDETIERVAQNYIATMKSIIQGLM